MAKSDSGSGNWLLTYADFITLMMIFFIVLYTLTPGVEQNKWEAIIGVFQGKDGVLKLNSVVNEESQKSDMTVVERAWNWDRLYQRIREEGLEESVEIELIPEGVKITLGESALFETYSVNLLPQADMILEEVARGIENYTSEDVEIVDVQGHTDNKPVSIDGYRKYESNWELGAGRALSVMQFLEARTTLGGEYFSISSYGEFRPVAPNTLPENMQKNRRVEVFIQYRATEITVEEAEDND